VLADPSSEQRSLLKSPLLYSSAIVLVTLLAVGFIMYSRWNDTRLRAQADAQLHAEKQRERDRVAVEQLGGKEFSILDFYASPRAIRRGESAKLCYGVSDAQIVKLEPQPHAVWPSADNCVDVSPSKTTTYRLTIVDASGNSKSQTLDLIVR
jgi:hypothetical protein